ncbi:hypothetical protein AC244_30000 [Ensifer adhaerens]|uniref:Uncharacterized protein n=1 Tax=Ensifer adhaerens TaxID=106592 RepID=A0A0L8BGB1_ENSAD|nr:hypothetical protein AC244_30000 [Ensifer adhaerens]
MHWLTERPWLFDRILFHTLWIMYTVLTGGGFFGLLFGIVIIGLSSEISKAFLWIISRYSNKIRLYKIYLSSILFYLFLMAQIIYVYSVFIDFRIGSLTVVEDGSITPDGYIWMAYTSVPYILFFVVSQIASRRCHRSQSHQS